MAKHSDSLRIVLSPLEQSSDVVAPVVLPLLPDAMLSLIFAHLPANSLAAVTSASQELMVLGFVDELWEQHSDTVGAQKRYGLRGTEFHGRKRFIRHMSMACVECRMLTPYVFGLTGQRLCEPCERAHQKKYRLATREQLMHERTGLEALGKSRLNTLFATAP